MGPFGCRSRISRQEDERHQGGSGGKMLVEILLVKVMNLDSNTVREEIPNKIEK